MQSLPHAPTYGPEPAPRYDPGTHREGVGGAVSALALDSQGHTGGEGLEAQDGQLVGGLDLVVVLCGMAVCGGRGK